MMNFSGHTLFKAQRAKCKLGGDNSPDRGIYVQCRIKTLEALVHSEK